MPQPPPARSVHIVSGLDDFARSSAGIDILRTVTVALSGDRSRNIASSHVAPGTRLILVRHGEAYCNTEGYIGGHRSCRGLTERGVAQSEVLAKRIARTQEFAQCSAIWTSVLPRAIETAVILRNALPHLDVEQSCSLCERHPGEADGLTWDEYEQRHGRGALPGDDPNAVLSEGGESLISFVERAEEALYLLAHRYAGQSVMIVTHGGIIDSSLIGFLDLPFHGNRVRLHPEHTSITEWEYIGTKWRLVRYNDAAHLGEPECKVLLTPAPEWVNRESI